MKKTFFENVLLVAGNIAVGIFWVSGSQIDVYSNSTLGAVYEMGSLPMLGLGLGLPILSIYLIVKNKGMLKIWPILSLLISITTIFIIIKSEQKFEKNKNIQGKNSR